MISSLEAFQGEIAKRILKWPRHHSNTAAVVVVGLQSVESRILERKLGFLHWVLENGSSCVSGRAVEAMSYNISNSCLVKECEELEESCSVSFTRDILGGQAVWGRGSQEKLRSHDRKQLLSKCQTKAPIVAVLQERGLAEAVGSGLGLWGAAHQGPTGA